MTWQGKGSTRRWRRLRALVLERDNYVCQVQRPGCLGEADQCHHVYGHGVSDDPAHLVACCSACNHAIGDPRRLDPVDVVRRTAW